ncbi:Meiotic nuclear division protein 1 [Fasciolopsis buskii]|uniref:Meiotic nuclear division protein 1 n=1 Tax=Fasciolopsis buskii TaxID=27845 RepID=A0A8E0RKL1_9TREM|nr:Meiotic nuclear division protein 1 [Fasciolopsis buski]
MSVKDVLMSLVHDGMVDTEKIGTCVYFWAFPNKATQKASWFVFRISRYCLQHKGTIQKLKEDIVATRARTARLKNALQEARTARQDTDERRKVLDELDSKRASFNDLTTELFDLRRLDPDRLRSLEEERQVALDSANRWTGKLHPPHCWYNKKDAGKISFQVEY